MTSAGCSKAAGLMCMARNEVGARLWSRTIWKLQFENCNVKRHLYGYRKHTPIFYKNDWRTKSLILDSKWSAEGLWGQNGGGGRDRLSASVLRYWSRLVCIHVHPNTVWH
jgi:hypothetical protein